MGPNAAGFASLHLCDNGQATALESACSPAKTDGGFFPPL